MKCRDQLHELVKEEIKKKDLSTEEWNIAMERSFNSMDNELDLYLLSQKWKELVEKGQAKQLQPHEYNSGTFTLSNLGMFGVDRFDVILPLGQGDIMAARASKPTAIIVSKPQK